MIGSGPGNEFVIQVYFDTAFKKDNSDACGAGLDSCGNPDTWLSSTTGKGEQGKGVIVKKTVKNNEQEKFLIGIQVEGAVPGTYVFNARVCTNDLDFGTTRISTRCPDGSFDGAFTNAPDPYNNVKKIYVEVN